LTVRGIELDPTGTLRVLVDSDKGAPGDTDDLDRELKAWEERRGR